MGSYLGEAFGVEVRRVDASRILSGASRDTWDVHVEMVSAPGEVVERDLVFRLDPEQSLLPSNRSVEFAVYQAFRTVPGVPVPNVLFIEDDPAVLGYPFFVMEKVRGTADVGELFSSRRDSTRPAIGREMMQILGRIAAVDHRELGLDDVLGDVRPEEAWAVQLEHWEKVLHDHDSGPMPITQAAIRWLRRNPPPPPARISVVHGDYRAGNFLYTDRIEAILDWEMVHVGDAHEDLAWAFGPLWSSADPKLTGALLDRESAIAHWETTSGLQFDRAVLGWWEVFMHVKSLGIWLTGVASGAVKFVFSGWFLGPREELWMLEKMRAVE